jgi:pyruvate dehydrogenase E2 component (dihydrolipoamide acetyltransferase)
MATEVILPRQGQSVESCLINEWKKQEGDSVKEGEIICEVETDKASFEIEAPASGTLLEIVHPEGDDVPVLEVIAYIGTEGEVRDEAKAAAGAEKGREAAESGGSAASRHGSDNAAAGGKAAAGGSASSAASAGKKDRGTASSAGAAISPRARKLAETQDIDTGRIEGSGPKGRIIVRDIEEAMAAGPRAGEAPSAAQAKEGASGAPRSGSSVSQEIPVKGVRKLIAERMNASLSTTAQLTLHSSADARNLLAYRTQCKNSAEDLGLQNITLNDMVLFAAARTVADYKEMNRHFLGDTMLEFEHVDLGFAVDTPRGLMVPVIRAADTLSLKQISEEAKRLGSACIEGGINPEELSGGTFTVSNLGALGVERFTPVLNNPQVGILGVCSIKLQPVPGEDGVEFVPHIGLSLTIDHQAVDGAPAARFLNAVSERIAAFSLTLAG